MTNKTPYELRFDLLTFAQSTLESQYHCNTEKIKWEIERNLAKLGAGVAPEVPLPNYPSKEEIFALAEEYKKFVEQK